MQGSEGQEEPSFLLASRLPGYTKQSVPGFFPPSLPLPSPPFHFPPSLKGLIFASNSKGLAEMGVARPGLVHLGSEVILLNL